MAFDPASLGAVPVDDAPAPAPAAAPPPQPAPQAAPFDPTQLGAVPVPDPSQTPPAAPASGFDPTKLGAVPVPAAPAFDPTTLGAQPVSDDEENYIAQQRDDEQQSLPQKALNTAKGIGEGLWNFATETVPGIVKGAYGLATDPTLTPGQKLLAAGNTVLSNLATLPYLARNAVTGAHNIFERNFGSGVTDQEYGDQWRELQQQDLTRRAFLNNGLQTMFGYNDGQDPSTYHTLPATAEQYQEQLSPLLDVTNAIPFAGGALAKLGRSAMVDAGTAAARSLVPSMGRRILSSVLSRGADVSDAGASVMDSIRTAPKRALMGMGVPEEAATHMAGAPIHLLAGAAGGAEAILPILAGEAAPGLLRQFSTVQRAASQAVLTGESTASFVGRMAQGTTGFTRTILNALDQTGLARVMGTVGDVAASGIHGGVLNPLVPIQFLASSNPEEFGQQLGQNIGFGVAGAGAAHLGGESPAQVASRNYNDVVQFASRLARASGADDQLDAFNQMPFRAQVAVAQFANTRPDVDVVLRPGGENTTSLASDGRRTVTLNTANPAAAVAHIAAHEYVHTLMMVGDNRSRVISGLMGNPDLGTQGPLGRWADGSFVPSDPFRQFIDRYSAALAKDGATVNAKADPPFYQSMAEEFYAETMASRLAGTNAAGDTGLSRVYRTGDTISKLADTLTGRSGPGVLDYLDRKYAQGRIAPRFGAADLESSIKAGPHAKVLTGLQVLGMRALRENETRSGKPQQYANDRHVEPTFSLNELRQNPAAAAKLFGASHDLVFAPDGSLVGQRTRAQANAAARAQGRIWFDTLSRMPTAGLPPGAVRAVARTDAKGHQVVELEGKFLTDDQISALVKANGMNRYQEGVLRQVNRALQAQDGNVHHVVYQTASDGKGRYATLASSSRDMVVRQIRVTKDRNIVLDAFDVDQFLRNYDRMVQSAASRGGRMPLAHPEQALRDYLANQALGYTGAGQALDPAHPPAQPPARIFSAHDAHTVNELFGVGTKDNAGVNPLFHELDEAGVDRSRSTFKSFRLDRVNSLEATPDVLPVDYYRVKYNRSPNYRQEDEDAIRSGHGQNLPPSDGDRVHAAAPAQVPQGAADRLQPAVSGNGRADLRPGGDRQEPRGYAGQAAQTAGPRDADRASHPDARGRVPDAQDARLVAPYSPDAGRRLLYSPNSVDEAARPGDENVRQLARRYRAAVPNLGPEHSGYAPINENLSRRVADAYEALRSDPSDPRVRAAYDAFINETLAQWNAAHAAGYRFEPWLKGGQPYASSREMLADLAQNRHLHFFPTIPEGGIGAFGEGEGVDPNHPLLREVGHWNGVPLVANDVFRAVHDMFGHAQGGFEFGPRGELNAYLEHRGLYTPLARRAMTSETMGQNSWVNFGAHMRRPDGTIPARGDADYVPLQDRRYAEQKAAILPEPIMRELEDVRRSPNSLDGGGTVDGNDPENSRSAPQARAPGVGLAAGAGPGGGPQPREVRDADGLAKARAVPPEHFYRDYLKGSGTEPGSNDSDALLRHAAESGLIVRPSVIRALAPLKAGTDTREHYVYLLPDHDQVIKVVQPGKWGIAGSDLAYFKNLRDMNLLTGGRLGIEVIGVTPMGTFPSAVTRMRYVVGVHPTQAYLTKYLEDRGFERRDVFGHIYDHLDSDVELWDAHTKNFIMTPDGALIPIDLHLRGDLRAPDAPRFSPNEVDNGGREAIVNPNEAAQAKEVPRVPRTGSPGRAQQPPPGPSPAPGIVAERHQPPDAARAAAPVWAPRLVAQARDKALLKEAGYEPYNRFADWYPEGIAKVGENGAVNPDRVFFHRPATPEGLSSHWEGRPEPWRNLPDETLSNGENLRDVARRVVETGRDYAENLVKPMLDVDKTGSGWLPDQLPQPLSKLRDYHTIWLKKPGMPERNWRDGTQEFDHEGQRFSTRWDDWTEDKDYVAHANVSIMAGPDGRDRVVVWEAQPTYRLPKTTAQKKEALEPRLDSLGLSRSQTLEQLALAVRDFARDHGNLPIVLGDARTVQDVYGRRGPVSKTFNVDYNSEGYATRAFKRALAGTGPNTPLKKIELPEKLWMPHHDEAERHGFTGYEFPSSP